MATEEFTHDLIHYDMNLKELKRLNGTPAEGVQLEAIKSCLPYRRVVQPSIGNWKLLWLNSASSLCEVDLKTFKTSEIVNFWTYKGKKSTAVFVTATSDFKRFTGIGLSPDGVQTLHVNDIAGGSGFSSASIDKLFKSRLSLT